MSEVSMQSLSCLHLSITTLEASEGTEFIKLQASKSLFRDSILLLPFIKGALLKYISLYNNIFFLNMTDSGDDWNKISIGFNDSRTELHSFKDNIYISTDNAVFNCVINVRKQNPFFLSFF